MSQDNSIEAILSGAIALAKAGDRQPALGLIKQVLASEPNNVTALLWAAYLHDDIASIEATLGRVLELDPYNAKALEWQALIRQHQVADSPPLKAAKGKAGRAVPGPLVNYTPPIERNQSQSQLARQTIFRNKTVLDHLPGGIDTTEQGSGSQDISAQVQR